MRRISIHCRFLDFRVHRRFRFFFFCWDNFLGLFGKVLLLPGLGKHLGSGLGSGLDLLTNVV